jgi:hypothetical protein
MTKAEQTRKIMEEANAEQQRMRDAKHSRYPIKVISGKVCRRAKKGFNNAKVKIPKSYSSMVIADKLANGGFDVVRSSVNGKAVLTIKW